MRKNPVKPTSRVYEGGLNQLKPGGFFWVGFYPNNPVYIYTCTVISRKLWNNYMKTSLLIDFMTDDNKCLCVFCPN